MYSSPNVGGLITHACLNQMCGPDFICVWPIQVDYYSERVMIGQLISSFRFTPPRCFVATHLHIGFVHLFIFCTRREF